MGLPQTQHPDAVLTIPSRLVSGGSDATIKLWDLEQGSNPSQSHTHRPAAIIPRAGAGSSAAGHRFGITHLSFYPFDSAAFLSCSHDQTLKLWSTERASVSGSFNLGARVYTHATSPIASHLLVACGTQHPAVRLVDLRSSAAVQSLVSPGQIGGSAGATLAVAWSPAHEHVLAAGSVDGAVRIWDVRKSNGLVALLDQEDTTGLAADGGPPRAPRLSAKAHAGPVNGLTWTDDGAYIVSAGHDRRIRVWDAATGANTLASFGPSIRNSQMGTTTMFVSPVGLTPPGRELLFFPNETEILVMDLHEGSIVTKLRGMGPAVASVGTQRGGERAIRNRVTSSTYSYSVLLTFDRPTNLHVVLSCVERRRRRRQFKRRGHGRKQRSRRHLQRAFGRTDPGLAAQTRRRR